MAILKNKHKIILVNIVLITITIASLVVSPQAAFPQQKEFLRLRSTPQGAPITGDSTNDVGMVEYYIGPGDIVDVYVWGNPDLTREVTIRSDGKMAYPFIGTFKAAGLSIDQLQATITKKLAEYIRAPQVIVSLKSSAGNKIIILGRVNYPGVFSFKGTINVLDALAMAGDFTDDGKSTSVIVVSDNMTMKPKIKKLNVLKAMRDGIISKDMLLKPNDVIYVPRSTIGDINKFWADIQPTISTLSNLLSLNQSGVTTATMDKAWFMHRSVKVVPSND